jgi:hypothetical protein
MLQLYGLKKMPCAIAEGSFAFLSHREVLKKNTTQKHNVDITLSPEEERNAEVQRRSG